MGGSSDSGSPIDGGSPESESPIKFDWEGHKPDYRKIAAVRVMTGVPAFGLCVFSLFLTYRYLERPMGDVVFWTVLGAVAAVFAVYFGQVVRLARRATKAQAQTLESEEEKGHEA